MQLLLVSEQKVAAGETSRAFWALKGLFFSVGALVSLQMLETGECTLARLAGVRARLVGLGRREVVGGRLCCVHRDCRSFTMVSSQSSFGDDGKKSKECQAMRGTSLGELGLGWEMRALLASRVADLTCRRSRQPEQRAWAGSVVGCGLWWWWVVVG